MKVLISNINNSFNNNLCKLSKNKNFLDDDLIQNIILNKVLYQNYFKR